MAADSIKLGTCSITFQGVDMGLTIGGVEVTYTPEYHETKVDQYTGIVERFLIGEKLSAKVPLAESTLANLNKAIAESTVVTNEHVNFGSQAGKRASLKAGMLVLHPIENAAGNRNDDVTLYKAHSNQPVTIAYKNDGERILEVTFEALVDTGRADGNMLGMIGDSL